MRKSRSRSSASSVCGPRAHAERACYGTRGPGIGRVHHSSSSQFNLTTIPLRSRLSGRPRGSSLERPEAPRGRQSAQTLADLGYRLRTLQAPALNLRNLSTRMRHGVREFTVAGSAHSSRRTGSVNVNVEPAPAWLFTQIFPPWSSMNLRERARPSPVPSAFLSAAPTCRNSSNTAS
jgi:hypothetical protein